MSVVLGEHLPLLATAPNGIQKLRGLILELAVRGKLLPQDPNDEPASELLKRTAKERARLETEGVCKKSRSTPIVAEDERPYLVPNGWAWVRLSEIGHDWGQKTPDEAFTYIDVSAVDNTRGTITAPNVVAPNDAPSRARKLVRRGTVIYSTVRPYLLNIAVIDRDLSPSPIASTAFAIVHPLSGISSQFIFWYLRSPVFVRYVESVQTGIAYPAVNDAQFFTGLFPLPPLAEQHRIVAKVDELMALCNRLEAEQADSASAHVRLVETLLGMLCQSSDAADLTANWQRLAEHFDTLITTEASIDALKQIIIHLAYSGRLTESDVGRWCKAKLSEITDAVADIDHKMPKAVSEGVIFLSAKDLKDNGTLDFSQPKYISREDFERLSRRICPKRGDIIYSRIGARLGKARLVEVDTEFLVSYSCCVVRPNLAKVDKHYLVKFLDSRLALDQAHLGKQSIGVPDLGLGVIKAFEVPLPPMSEQHRIVAKVDELMAFCDSLKADLATGRQRQTTLADAMIESALS